MVEVNENGWTIDELGLIWLKKLFGLFTESRKTGRYRLLILDGHKSHVTAEFDRYCTEYDIIILCMPPYSSHLLQLLDVACFAVLKRSYGTAVQEQIRLSINYVDKDDFLQLYL